MLDARMATEPEALIGVSGKLNVSGAPGFAAAVAAALSDDDALCPEFRFAEFDADEAEDAGEAPLSGDAASFTGVCRKAFAPLAAGIVQR
jgi:hypothetical protein